MGRTGCRRPPNRGALDLDAATLAQYPLLISGQSLVRQQISNWFGANLDQLDIVGTYTLLYNASLLVKTSNSAALCIDGIINTKDNGLKFVPFKSTTNRQYEHYLEKRPSLTRVLVSFLKKPSHDQTNKKPSH